MENEKDIETVDASLRFQDSLPITSDELLDKLDNWEIEYKLYSHKPLRTVSESKDVQNQFLQTSEGGGHIKNLYLRDHKKQNILLVTEQDRKIDLKVLKTKLATGRLSFGSAERLLENLGVRPGAVTPLSMITGIKKGVTLFIESELKYSSYIYAHPLVNDRTIGITIPALKQFFEKINVDINWIDLDDLS